MQAFHLPQNFYKVDYSTKFIMDTNTVKPNSVKFNSSVAERMKMMLPRDFLIRNLNPLQNAALLTSSLKTPFRERMLGE